MKRYSIFSMFFLGAIIASGNMYAQTTNNYSIGQILAAGTGGLTLADGTVAHAETFKLSTSSSFSTSTGTYNTNIIGGFYDGVDNGASTSNGTASTNGLALPNYTGDKQAGDFTLLDGIPNKIDGGAGNGFPNGVGIHVWFSAPINVPQVLFIDIDGDGSDVGNNPQGNGEWGTLLAYNGTAAVSPAIVGGTNIGVAPRNVTGAWYNYVNSKIPGIANFSTVNIPKQINNQNSGDPDNVNNQVLFNLSGPVDHLFYLFGIAPTVGVNGGSQNMGISAISVTSVPLPLTLVAFNAIAQQKTALLTWTTANEENVESLEVQRSNDAQSFTTIEKVQLKGTATGQTQYAVKDAQPASGNNFYRLQLQDFNGKITYSDVKTVSFNEQPNTSVTPNPTKGASVIRFQSPLTENAQVQVYDANGRMLECSKILAGAQTATADMQNFLPGVYYVTIRTISGKTITTQKIFKQ